uniref:Hexosyltransferase n=1 Tax=Ascaris suum TaxID=6253 RepID=F1L5U0_ASCSU
MTIARGKPICKCNFRCFSMGSLLVVYSLIAAIFILHNPTVNQSHLLPTSTDSSRSHIMMSNATFNHQMFSINATTVNVYKNRSGEHSADPEMQITTTSGTPLKYMTISPDIVFIRKNQFKWIIVEDFCVKRYPQLKLLIIVHTAIEHFHRRQIYRDMYGEKFYQKQGVAILFVLGVSANEDRNKRILEESSTYHDIIQEDFLDVYRNLTWKALSWLRFIDENCSNVRYVLKIDDDVIFDLFAVIKYLGINSNRTIPIDDHKRIICGLCDKGSLFPQRDRSNKWFVTKEEYEYDFYYPYCRGLQYIISPSTAKSIRNAAIGEKYFWIDDYFITGHLAHKINATFDDIRSLQAGKEQLLERKALFWWITNGNMIEGKEVWNKLRIRYEIDNISGEI